jgi:DNA-directed RNA polymerase alpha subunit
MQCKCGNTIHPAYMVTGKCEDCYANFSSGLSGKEKEEPKKPDPKQEEILFWPIAELDLGSKISNMLSEKGIVLIDDLVEKTETDLKKIRHMGIKTLDAIKIALENLSLALKQSEPQQTSD